MATHNPITKLESQGESFNIGANFSNVFLSDDNNFSLFDLYEHYNYFLNANLYVAYGEDKPDVKNINVWYDTTEVELD